MQILITGATGFVGRALCQHLHGQGHQLLVVSRKPDDAQASIGVPVTAARSAVDFADRQVDGVVNLAGEPIFNRRWSDSQKERLMQSRIEATRDIGQLCSRMATPPAVMVSASAMGWYGDHGSHEVTEQTPPADTRKFDHRLCQRWEEEALALAGEPMRVACIRIGLVLDRDGGMLKPMLPMFRLGLGGRVGDGRQYMPWIHRHDLVRIIDFLLQREGADGIWNAGAPNPVTNAEFTRTVAGALNRPAFFVMPAAVLRPVLGEMSELLLGGARMKPARLEEAGFTFDYPHLEQAMAAIVEGRGDRAL
ncbi:TIGR01777 family oxidoreductase [Kushneria aurantia]|uniref:TIGR01777 family oxidoreductase n=1 Tax=Kushneria aurantia TaxID=504092 RepID=A0ABV6G6C1_9GAMM|nr:TIGR01777 family oxidoreductase [Kushneria aurantia]